MQELFFDILFFGHCFN